MSLWGDLATATSEYGVFAGSPENRMLVLIQSVHTHDNMRFLEDGTPVNRELFSIFEKSFRDHHGLSEDQFTAILDIYDRSGLRESWNGAEIPHAPIGGVPDRSMRRCFVDDRKLCCGRVLRVRWISATVYENDDVYDAWNVVKDCRHGCRTRYLFDRKILPGTVGGDPASFHVYKAWTSGELPAYVSNKSGHSILSSSLLTRVAVQQASSR